MMDSDIVVHCAAIAGIDTVIKSPVSTMKVNLIGSANVLEAASNLQNCQRIVCFSTSEVFGQQAFNSTESDNTVMGKVGEARWTYAVSKAAEEHLAIAYYNEKWLPTTVLRPFNVYGPFMRLNDRRVIPDFVKFALEEEDIRFIGHDVLLF